MLAGCQFQYHSSGDNRKESHAGADIRFHKGEEAYIYVPLICADDMPGKHFR